MKHFGLLLVAILVASYSYAILPDRTWFFPAQDMPDYKAGHGGKQSPMVVDFQRWMNETLDFMDGKM